MYFDHGKWPLAMRRLIAVLGMCGIVSTTVTHTQTLEVETRNRVTLHMREASPMNAIVAAGEQSHYPIGVIIGDNWRPLCVNNHRSIDIDDSTPLEAITKIAGSAGYSVTVRGAALEVVGPDLAQWRQDILKHRYNFPAWSQITVAGLGDRLNGWMRMEIGHVQTYISSTGHAANSPRYDLDAMPSASTEEIANSIVTLGSKGIWVFRPITLTPASALDEEIRVFPYDDPEELKSVACGP
jgi:hypothetical protein